MAWNPIADRAPQRFELEISRDADGVAQAAATFRPWSARERMRYEDAVTESLLTTDAGGDETIRMGTLRVISVALTIDEVEGFPATVEIDDVERVSVRDAAAPGGIRIEERKTRRSVPFDPRREACLVELDPETFDELYRHARTVQVPPGLGDDELAGEATVIEEADPAADPSRTPSTPEAESPPTPPSGGSESTVESPTSPPDGLAERKSTNRRRASASTS